MMRTSLKPISLGLIAAATFNCSFSTIASAAATSSNTKVVPIQVAIKQAADDAKAAKEAVAVIKKAEDTLKITTQTALKAKQEANKAVDAAQQSFNKATYEYNSAQTAYNTAAQNLATADTAAKTATQNLATAQTTYNTAVQNLAAAQAALNAATTATARAQAQTAVNTATNRLTTATNQLNTAKNKSTEATNKLNLAQTNFNSANSKLTDATAKLNAATQAKDQAIAQAKTVADNADKSVKDAQDALAQAKSASEAAAQKAQVSKIAAEKASDWSTMKRLPIKDRLEDPNFLKLLPNFQAFLQPEGKPLPGAKIKAQKLEFDNLYLKQKHNVRVWFLNEGAMYKNQLAFEAIKGNNSYTKGMIFENVSCNSLRNKCELGDKDGVLDVGDFVDLGTFRAGTQINFLLKADGYTQKTRNGDIYGADPFLNPDGLEHLMAWKVGDYLMMAFEDMRNGGDQDYNDVVFAVDFGKNNYKTTPIPEPSATLPLLGLGAFGMLKLRRRKF